MTDSTGAVIPSAELTFTETATGATAKVTSGPDGLYSFPNLAQGTYSLKVSAKGFKDYVQTGIVIHLGDTIRQDVTMQIGASIQTVEVASNASPLNYETPEVKAQISSQQINDLPLEVIGAQRNSADFALVNAGVSQPSPADQNIYTAHINGGQAMTDEGVTDGVSVVEGVMSQSGLVSLQAWPIAPEATGEVMVLTSNYDVQYGSSSGAVTIMSTKEGTSEFHGGTYEFMRNTDLNARQFGVSTRPEDIMNDFGAFVGGPIKFLPKFWSGKKRSYFFLDFEGYRSRGGANKAILTVPDALMKEGNFSEWPNPIYDPATTTPIARAKICCCNVPPMCGASSSTLAIMITFRSTDPSAGTKKWPRALAMPMNTAARHTSSM